jgi:hypothetical protein
MNQRHADHSIIGIDTQSLNQAIGIKVPYPDTQLFFRQP